MIANELWILRQASGAERVISCNAGPIRDHAGQITGGVIAWRDVSPQHEMEQEIRRQADALRANDRSKDTFLSMVSHELRQPLGALHAAAQVLRLQATGGNENLRRPVDVMERQVNHLTRLVDDLLDIGRMSQGIFAIVSAPMDLVQIVREAAEAAEDVEAAAAAARVAVALTLPSHAVPMSADAARLRQLVLNLLTNALRHTPQNGRITCTVDVRDDQRAAIRVADTGRGISAELLPHLFDPFVQGADASTAGLGLGLAIAKGIIELHHGTIAAHSDGGGTGATFEITLPLSSGEGSTPWADDSRAG